MDQRKQSKFNVIELLEPLYTEPDKYVCIPNSWIRLRETEDGLVLVKFPTEKLSETKKRVKREENFSNNWSTLLADVKYGTDSYKDANEFIKILEKISVQEQKRSKGVREDKSSVPDGKVPDSPAELVTKEICTAADLLNNDIELLNNKMVKQNFLFNLELVDSQNALRRLEMSTPELGRDQETQAVGPADSSANTKRYLTRQALRISSPTNNPKSLDQAAKVISQDNSKSSESNNPKSLDYVEKVTSQKNSKSSESTNPKSLDQAAKVTSQENSKSSESNNPKSLDYVEKVTSQKNSKSSESTNPKSLDHVQKVTSQKNRKSSESNNSKSLDHVEKVTSQENSKSNESNNPKSLDHVEKVTSQQNSKSNKSNDKVEHEQETTPPEQTHPDPKNESGIVSALRSQLGDNYKEILQQLYSETENNLKVLNKLELIFMKNCALLKSLIDTVDQASNCDPRNENAAIIQLKNYVNKEVNTKPTDEGKTGLEVQIGDKNVSGGDEGKKHKYSNPLNKIRGQARKFTLPPEYDPNNSKWTLKHRKKTKDLVELMPQSGVYVDAIKLGNCRRLSKDSKTLARMLLVEVFSESALGVCSLTGKKANAFDLEGTGVRPGLDEHARTVLLNYVEQHALENKWVNLSTHTILNSLRNKICEMRTKAGFSVTRTVGMDRSV